MINIQNYFKTQEALNYRCKVWATQHENSYVSSVDHVTLENGNIHFSYQGSCSGMPVYLRFRAEYLKLSEQEFIRLATDTGSLKREIQEQDENEIARIKILIEKTPEYKRLQELYQKRNQTVDIVANSLEF